MTHLHETQYSSIREFYFKFQEYVPVSAKGMMAMWSLRAWLGPRHTKHFDRTEGGKRSQCLQKGRQKLCSHIRPERLKQVS